MIRKAKISVVILLLAFIVAAIFIPTQKIAFADEIYSLTYVFNGKDIFHSPVEKGASISSLVSYDNLLEYVDEAALVGKKIVYVYESNGEPVTVPFTVENNVRIAINLVDDEQTVTFSYYYGYGENDREKIVYKLGEKTAVPSVVHDTQVLQNKFFTDNKFRTYAHIPKFASADFACYPLLDSLVKVTFNGQEKYCHYGSTVSDVLDTQTHAVTNVSLDKEKTKKFDCALLGDVVLYGDIVRTHYRVTFDDGLSKYETYVPVEHPVVTADMLPLSAVEWRLDESKRVEYPLTVTDDIVLYSSNGMNNPLTNTDRVLIYVFGAVLVAMAVWGAVYEHLKTVKKRKKSQKSVALENDCSAEKNEQKSCENDESVDSPKNDA